ETSVKETFVHEIGHTQGRRHSPCGDAGGPDGNYPYADADIGSFGYSAVKNQLFFPNGAKDYMSYCNPTHVSDYVWNRVLPYVQTISGWGAPSGTPDADIGGGPTLLVSLTDQEGTANWHHIPGSLEVLAEEADAVARVVIDGVTLTLPMRVSALPHEAGYRRAVELPAGVGPEDIESLAMYDDASTTLWATAPSVDVAAMQAAVAEVKAWAAAQTQLQRN
ncbi:MAG: M66 family metalloprotease, partial [Nannocystaceae bacterium]